MGVIAWAKRALCGWVSLDFCRCVHKCVWGWGECGCECDWVCVGVISRVRKGVLLGQP